jgi:hypothetical protein
VHNNALAATTTIAAAIIIIAAGEIHTYDELMGIFTT